MASVHTPGYERTGNSPVGCWVATLGICINTSREEAGGGWGCPRVQYVITEFACTKPLRTFPRLLLVLFPSMTPAVKGVLCHIRLQLLVHFLQFLDKSQEIYSQGWNGLLVHPNRTKPSLMLLAAPVL